MFLQISSGFSLVFSYGHFTWGCSLWKIINFQEPGCVPGSPLSLTQTGPSKGGLHSGHQICWFISLLSQWPLESPQPECHINKLKNCSSPSYANAGDLGNTGSIPESGRSPRGGNGNPLQYSCLENPMDGRASWCLVHPTLCGFPGALPKLNILAFCQFFKSKMQV